jgi:hypothetical protein
MMYMDESLCTYWSWLTPLAKVSPSLCSFLDDFSSDQPDLLCQGMKHGACSKEARALQLGSSGAER